jgi:hypothetical protein
MRGGLRLVIGARRFWTPVAHEGGPRLGVDFQILALPPTGLVASGPSRPIHFLARQS